MKIPVFLDSSCFIYLFESHPKYNNFLKSIFSMMSFNKVSAVTSIITVTEVLTKPFEEKNNSLIENYLEAFVEIPNLKVVNPDNKIAIEAARIRAELHLNLPDAYQLAIAMESKCKTFLTNDKGLKKFKGLQVLILDDLI